MSLRKLPELSPAKQPDDAKSGQPPDDGVQNSPERRGIFRRFFNLFGGRKPDEKELTSPMFRLEKVQPKKGDYGAISPRVGKTYKHEVGMSL